jgi:hypothetical protein
VLPVRQVKRHVDADLRQMLLHHLGSGFVHAVLRGAEQRAREAVRHPRFRHQPLRAVGVIGSGMREFVVVELGALRDRRAFESVVHDTLVAFAATGSSPHGRYLGNPRCQT